MEILSIFVAKEIFKLKWNEIVCELPSLVRWEGAAVIASARDSSHNNVFESYSGITDDRKKKKILYFILDLIQLQHRKINYVILKA